MRNIIIIICIFGAFLFGYFINNTQEKNIVDKSSNVVISDAIVKYVIDGDTLVLNNNKKVRLIGIDTPEIEEDFYEEAKQELKKLVDGKKVQLKKEVRETDKYNRLLRHIYIDGVWVNKKILEDGLARTMAIPPDTLSASELKQAEDFARKNKKGIWKK